MNKKVFTIIKREYLTRVRTKGFIIGTLLFPLILVFIFGGVFIFSIIFKPASQQFYIVDQTGMVYQQFTGMLSDTLKNGDLKYRFIEQKVDSAGLEAALTEYQKLESLHWGLDESQVHDALQNY